MVMMIIIEIIYMLSYIVGVNKKNANYEWKLY